MSLLDSALWDGKIYLNGWRPGRGGTGDAVEPATGETLGRYGVASVEDVREAAAVAAKAQKEWAARNPEDRAAVLRRAGQLWEEHCGGNPGLDRPRIRRHPAQSGAGNPHRGQRMLRRLRPALPPGRRRADLEREPLVLRPAPARRRRFGDCALQLPADPLHPRRRPGAGPWQRRAAQAGPAHCGLRRRHLGPGLRGGRASARPALAAARRRRDRLPPSSRHRRSASSPSRGRRRPGAKWARRPAGCSSAPTWNSAGTTH